jgi:hypothetical protein
MTARLTSTSWRHDDDPIEDKDLCLDEIIVVPD